MLAGRIEWSVFLLAVIASIVVAQQPGGCRFVPPRRGNVTMLIWLGKQLLEQSDKPAAAHPQNGGLGLSLDILDRIVHGEN